MQSGKTSRRFRKTCCLHRQDTGMADNECHKKSHRIGQGPWLWGLYFPPQRLYIISRPHGVIFQKTVAFITTRKPQRSK